jgi:hypothetical protein
MHEDAPPTLSAYLLAEAQKFLIYPQRRYRTKKNLATQEFLDSYLRRLLAWRKTFAPQAVEMDVFNNEEVFGPTFLDSLLCRDLLRQVPDIADRTRKLRLLTLEGVSDEGFVHLREAANCYLHGLPEAAVALARAAVEFPLRKATGRVIGESTVAGLELIDVINRFGAKLLSPEAVNRAHLVRKSANSVLHPSRIGTKGAPADRTPITSDEALEVIEAARLVLRELGKRAG